MADHHETLRSMLQDIIKDNPEQASVTMHDYFVAKSREVAGLATPTIEEPPEPTEPVDTTPIDTTDE